MKVYRTTKELYGRVLTVLVTFDPKLQKKHIYTHEENIEKTQTELLELQQQLKNRAGQDVIKGKPMNKESVEARLKSILSRDHMCSIFITNIIINSRADRPLLEFRLDKKASGAIYS